MKNEMRSEITYLLLVELLSSIFFWLSCCLLVQYFEEYSEQ